MLRKMEERDIQAVLEIEELCFTSRWSETMLRYEMSENEFASFYVYEAANEIVGFIDFWITFEECQLAQIAVHPSHRRKGIADLMMQKMESIANQEGCERITLEVRVSNTAAKMCIRDSNS